MRRVDLHVHSTASDGTFSPSQIVELAAKSGLSAIAMTDHDTVLGYDEAAAAGARLGIEVVPGIEISTRYEGPVHILGYYVDPNSPDMAEVLDWIVKDRDERNEKMAARMAADGLPVSYAKMKERFGSVIGRPHFADILIELGLAKDVNEAFDLYVEKGRKYYEGRNFLTIERSIELICSSGGVAVLAHPFQYRRDDKRLRELIEHCMESGLSGLECRYSGYSRQQSDYLEALAEEYRLVKTGGSDFHGENKKHISLGSGTGELEVPYEYLEQLKKAAKR